MKPYTFSLRFAFTLSLCCAVILLGGCPQTREATLDASNAPNPEGAASTPLARIGEFSVTATPGADNLQTVDVYKNGGSITQFSDPVRDVAPDIVRHDFPLPGCTSQKVEIFTGGANCCFGYYILTACPDGQHAAFVKPLDGSMGAPVGSLRAYPVSDPSFMYYSKEPVSFIRPTSPRFTRYIVFDNGTWRADRIGEFPAAYRSLAGKALADDKMDKTAKAITVAYYNYMAGDKETPLKSAFRRALPKEYRNVSASIFEDIKKAAVGFNPVKNIDG
ncbi:MAG: hypothetical protein DELT_02390 [Desulfovibrio sp.]